MKFVWKHGWLAAITLGFLAGCGGGGGSEPGTAVPADGPGLQVARSGDLVAYVRGRIEQGSAQGLSLAAMGATALPAPADMQTIAMQGQAPAQEAGVEEDDLLKTDGSTVYALHPWASWESPMRPARLTAHRINADGSLTDLATVPLAAEYRMPGMYLAADARKLAVIGEISEMRDPPLPGTALTTVWPYRSTLRLDVFDTAGAAPVTAQTLRIDGSLVASRMVGSVLYVASTWMPDLSRYPVPAGSTPAQVEAALAGLTARELLPTVRVGAAAAQPLVDEADCLLQPRNASGSFQLTTITAIDLASPDLQRTSRCFVGGTGALYMTPQSVYLASSQSYGDVFIASMPTRFPPAVTTDIHKFALDGTQIDYRATGRVQGHLGWDREKAPYRMSEHEGMLRVLSFTGQTGWFGTVGTPQQGAPSPATLTVLREDASSRSLVTVATLPNERRPGMLGKAGEQIYGVRFAGDRAYLVTFQRVDPLYVLDLADPADPKVAGELSIPGYSDYLFPLDNGKLLGVGKDVNEQGWMQGVKVGLFDVANPAQPRALAAVNMGVRGTTSALDTSRHGISLLAQGNQVSVGLPVRVYEADAAGQSHPSYQGLARFAIDTDAGTMLQQPTAISVRFDGTIADSLRYAQYNLASERSLLTPGATYYLSGDQLRQLAQP